MPIARDGNGGVIPFLALLPGSVGKEILGYREFLGPHTLEFSVDPLSQVGGKSVLVHLLSVGEEPDPAEDGHHVRGG